MHYFRENILKYGSYFLVFFAPLVFLSHRLYPHISTKTFFIYGVVELLLFVWLYALIIDRSYRLSKKTLVLFLPLLGFVGWMSIASVTAVNPSLSFWSSFARGTGLLTLYHCLALACIIASLVKKHGVPYVTSLFQWSISGAFVLAISIWMGTDGFQASMRALETDAGGGFSGNSTLAAGYFLFALAMAGFLVTLKNISTSKKWLIGIAVATIIFSPVFASLHSLFSGEGILGTARGTILALATGIGATAIGYMLLSGKKVIRGISIAIVAIALTTFSFLWVQLLTPGTYLHTTFAEQARESRFIFWDIAEQAMRERPLLGYGPENYSIAYQHYFNPNILVAENNFEGWNDRAHNIFYELGATAGYPAIILYVVFIVSILYVLYRAYKKGHITRVQTSLFAGLCIAYIVNNLFTFDSNLSLMSLFLVAGVVYSLGDINDTKQKFLPVAISQANKNLLALGLLALFISVWIFLVHMPSVKSKAYTDTFAASLNKRPDMYTALLQGSHIGESWDVSELAFSTYRIYASNPASLKADKQKLPYLIKNLDELLKYLYTVSERNKTDYRLYITIAFLENTLTYLSDRPYNEETKNRILVVLEKAKALSPTNPNIYWATAQTKIWGNDFNGVEQSYREALVVAPRLPASYNLFLKYAQILGNQKLFNEILAEAKKNIPGYVFK